MAAEECGECKYFRATGYTRANQRIGTCHFNPPNANLATGHKWPEVYKDEWCGQFQPKIGLPIEHREPKPEGQK